MTTSDPSPNRTRRREETSEEDRHCRSSPPSRSSPWAAPPSRRWTIHKEYKAKDAKANCASCHVDKMPKKDKHDLNDFGKKVAWRAKGADGKIDWAKVPAAP